MTVRAILPFAVLAFLGIFVGGGLYVPYFMQIVYYGMTVLIVLVACAGALMKEPVNDNVITSFEAKGDDDDTYEGGESFADDEEEVVTTWPPPQLLSPRGEIKCVVIQKEVVEGKTEPCTFPRRWAPYMNAKVQDGGQALVRVLIDGGRIIHMFDFEEVVAEEVTA